MQSQSLTVQGQQSLTAVQYQKEQIELIKNTYAKGATDTELALFIEVAQRKGLDIFSRQIHFIKRKGRNGQEVADIQTGIDGYRSMAEDTGQYEGQDGPYWCGDDGEWKDIWVSRTPPVGAKVGILRAGYTKPFYAVALYREYVQSYPDGNPYPMWAKMPANQLAKCAEALALRKAFPRRLSGIYTQEEMAQVENAINIEAEAVEQRPSAKTPRAALKAVPKAAPPEPKRGEPQPYHWPSDGPQPQETEPGITTVQVMPQSTESDAEYQSAVEDDPLPEFAERQTDETPEEIEADRQELIAAIKVITLQFRTESEFEQWMVDSDAGNQTRGWLRTILEKAQAKVLKTAEATALVAITNPKDAPAQPPDGKRKQLRKAEDGSLIAVYEGSHMAGKVMTGEQSLAALNQWVEYWRTHPSQGQDLATVHAKVERVTGPFINFADLNAAEMAKAIRTLQEWRPDLDKQTAQKGAKK